MKKAIVMRLEGVYTRRQVGKSIPPIPSPSTIAGAFLWPLLAYYGRHKGAREVKELHPIIEHSLHSAYIALDKDTEITTTTLPDTKAKTKIEVTFTKNLYAILTLNDTPLTDSELHMLATTVQSIGENDSGLRVKEAFVVRPLKTHTKYVNTYVPLIPEQTYDESMNSVPFKVWKLKENVILRTNNSNKGWNVLLSKYLVPVKAERTSKITLKYGPNLPEGSKIPLPTTIEAVKVGNFIVPAMENIKVE